MKLKLINILIITNDNDIIKTVKEILQVDEEYIFKINHVTILSDGLQHLSKYNIDIILLDLNLPDCQGIETFQLVHNHVTQIPIMILIGVDEEETALETLELGGQNYLIKEEINPKIVRHTIYNLIQQNQLREKLRHYTKELILHESRFRSLIKYNADGIIIIDKNGIILFLNPAAEKLFNLPPDKLLDKAFGYSISAGEKKEIIISKSKNDKNAKIAEVRAVETDWENEKVLLLSLHDITELVHMREELRQLALVDELTKLYNRRGFLTLARQHLILNRRRKNDLFLIFADLDGLKLINDQSGHFAGDAALIETATILKKTFRESDIIARIGGDEFAVLTTDSHGTSSESLKTRLISKINKNNKKSKRSYTLSISIGIAEYQPSSRGSIEQLLARADQKMYQEKKRKRMKG
jgi:diguanylate cyclase (GGDEF)-like protein